MIYDCIVIGGGPAAYTAAIYSCRAGLKTLICEGESWGGQLMTTTEIENFPGFESINGYDLMDNMRNQCIKLNATIVSENVVKLIPGSIHTVLTTVRSTLQVDHGAHSFSNKSSSTRRVEEDLLNEMNSKSAYQSKTVIIATGATAKHLTVPGSVEFWNHGISACAVCDGALPLFRHKPVAVVGGGDTACEEAIFLSRFASTVYLLVRSGFRASKIMIDRVSKTSNIKIMLPVSIASIHGKGTITHVTLNNGEILKLSGLFYALGHTPNTAFLNGLLETTNHGYLITKNTKTSIAGIFAAGDVQDYTYRQAVTAAASGCMAALEAERYV